MVSLLPSFASLPHTWLQECRHPLFTFTYDNTEYAFLLFSLPTWIELLTTMMLQMFIAAAVAVLIYYKVVVKVASPNSGNDNSNKNPRNGSEAFTCFILTFGVFLPFFVFATKLVTERLNIRNQLFLFCYCVVTPTTAIFRLLQAYFGFTPPHAARSLRDFVFYFACPLLARFDTKTQRYVKTNARVIAGHLLRFVFLTLTTGLYQSLFMVVPWFPKFGHNTTIDYYALHHVMDPTVWLRTALYAVLLQQYLTTFGEGLMMVTNVLTGVQTQARTYTWPKRNCIYPFLCFFVLFVVLVNVAHIYFSLVSVALVMDNPMFASQSFSDFWGRRWNLLIHHCLKGGIYKPIRSLGGNQATAVMGSFLASGLFHEWIVPCVFAEYPNVVWGRQSVFFVWQAMLVALEAAVVGQTKHVQSLKMTLPRPVRSLLVILCGIPFGHWFLDAYVHSNFFLQGHMVMMAILPVNYLTE